MLFVFLPYRGAGFTSLQKSRAKMYRSNEKAKKAKKER